MKDLEIAVLAQSQLLKKLKQKNEILSHELDNHTWDCKNVFECKTCKTIADDFALTEDGDWFCNRCHKICTIEQKTISYHEKLKRAKSKVTSE